MASSMSEHHAAVRMVSFGDWICAAGAAAAEEAPRMHFRGSRVMPCQGHRHLLGDHCGKPGGVCLPVAGLCVRHAVLRRQPGLGVELALDGHQHKAAECEAGRGGAADDQVCVADRLRHLQALSQRLGGSL